MIIRYKTIWFSVKFDLTRKRVHRNHGPSLVRAKNIKEDQSLIHDETIDEKLITYEHENDDEEIFLLNESIDTGGIPSGWVVIPGTLFSRRSNANNNAQPGWMNLGNGIDGLVFSDKRNQGMSFHFDLGPDFKAGTKVYMDIGWMPMSWSQGNVVFFADYVAGNPNGGDTALMDTKSRLTLLHPGGGRDGEYRRASLSEDRAITPNVGPNGIISMELFRGGKDYRDSFYGSIALLNIKLYYKIAEEA